MSIDSAYQSGRHFLQIPGPSNVPESVLRAMAQPVIDHRGPDFPALTFRLLEKLAPVFNTKSSIFIYPASGTGGSWIVKLPSSRFEAVPENEFAMMEMARMLGMDVPETQLLPIEQIANIPEGIGKFGNSAFAIKRFDRANGQAIHIEDFAQVFGVYPQDKYKKASMRNIAQVIGIEGQEQDIAEFIRRLVFNTLIGNADMHLKNWSVIYKDKRNASIAPAYDFVSTIPYIPDNSTALKVSRSKKFSDFTLDELSHLAAKAMLPEKLVLDTAKQTVEGFYEIWAKEKTHLPLTKDMIDAIDKHLRDVPLR